MSNFKIDEILRYDKNYIGTYSKDNVPVLKNNESTIVNLDDSLGKGTHWISLQKNQTIKYFILIAMENHIYRIL